MVCTNPQGLGLAGFGKGIGIGRQELKEEARMGEGPAGVLWRGGIVM